MKTVGGKGTYIWRGKPYNYREICSSSFSGRSGRLDLDLSKPKSSSTIRRVHLRQKYPLLSSKIVNWPSWITQFRLHITGTQGSLLPRRQYDFNLSSMAVLASDLKSEVKLREKREISIHKRKMLCFTGLYTFDPSINQRSL